MLLAYSVFDKKVGSYYMPRFVQSPVEIQRILEQAVKDKGSSLALYPDDFAVYKVGSFDQDLGVFVIQTKPEFFAEISDFIGGRRSPGVNVSDLGLREVDGKEYVPNGN